MLLVKLGLLSIVDVHDCMVEVSAMFISKVLRPARSPVTPQRMVAEHTIVGTMFTTCCVARHRLTAAS